MTNLLLPSIACNGFSKPQVYRLHNPYTVKPLLQTLLRRTRRPMLL